MSTVPASDPGFFDLVGTARAVRFYKPDPVPADTVERLVWAATRAPSPGNTQDWTFIAVDDRGKLDRIAGAIGAILLPAIEKMPVPDRSSELMLQGARSLATNFGSAPLVIFVCGGVHYPAGRAREEMTWAALYPAAQNIILAARALGLGAAFTTFQGVAEGVVRSELGIPPEIKIAATIPVGYPAVAFGPVRRRPVSEVLRYNSYSGEDPA